MITVAATLITVKRFIADPNQDPYEPQAPTAETVVAKDIRATISSPSGREVVAGGSQEVVQFAMSCDPVDLKHTDRVLDQTTGEQYDVVWSRQRPSPTGLDHTRASLKAVTGLT
jgi:hypothetical protein